MDKEAIYRHYAKLPEEDGTFSTYFSVYTAHPQQKPDILKRACIELTAFCHFSMEVCTFFWSSSEQRYVQYGDDLELDKFQIDLFYEEIKVTHEDDLATHPYPNLKGLVHMLLLSKGKTYRPVFNRLLDGETFLTPVEGWPWK